jgi:hypothetical protein
VQARDVHQKRPACGSAWQRRVWRWWRWWWKRDIQWSGEQKIKRIAGFVNRTRKVRLQSPKKCISPFPLLASCLASCWTYHAPFTSTHSSSSCGSASRATRRATRGRSRRMHACCRTTDMFFICMGLIILFSPETARMSRVGDIVRFFGPTSLVWTGPHARTHTAHPSPKPPCRRPNTRCVRAHPPADPPHPPLPHQPHGVLVACIQPCTRLDDHTPRTPISPTRTCLPCARTPAVPSSFCSWPPTHLIFAIRSSPGVAQQPVMDAPPSSPTHQQPQSLLVVKHGCISEPTSSLAARSSLPLSGAPLLQLTPMWQEGEKPHPPCTCACLAHPLLAAADL